MKYVNIFIFCFSFSLVMGQSLEREVNSTCGAHLVSADGVSLHCTLGQLAVSDFNNGSIRLTQGFQQYYIIISSNGEFNSSEILVYPNPTSEMVFVELEAFDTYEILLFDELGRIVQRKTTTESKNELDLMMFPTGNYILQVYDSRKTLINSQKIQKINF